MICLRCRQEKPLVEFRVKSSRPTGHTQPCKTCDNSKTRSQYAVNKASILERLHRWNTDNAEKLKSQRRTRYKANPGKSKERAHKRRTRDLEKTHEQDRLRRIVTAEKVKKYIRAWRIANPEKSNLITQRRRARKRHLPDTFTSTEYAFMLHYWKYACAVCGNQDSLFWKLALDHVIALSSPHCPGTIATNMLPLCQGIGGCNNSKNNKDLHTWLLSRYPTRKVAQIEKAITVYFEVVRQRQQAV
jgi:hypothetical protein